MSRNSPLDNQGGGNEDHGIQPCERGRGQGRDRALERTLRDALALAASKKVADRRFGRLAPRHTITGRRDLRRLAAHLAGYGTLLSYIIWHQRRTQKQSAE